MTSPSAELFAGRRRGHREALGRLAVRAIRAVAMLFIVSAFVFFFTQALPGDVARSVLGQSATPEQIARINAELGLDQPVWQQYLEWLGGLLRFDLGHSLTSGEPVTTLVGGELLHTTLLVLMTVCIVVPASIALGTAAASRPGGVLDHVISGTVAVVLSIPEFVFGILVVIVLGINVLPVLPPTSIIDPNRPPLGQLDVFVLPVLTLAVTALPYLAESVKSAVREELTRDYATWAELSGVRRRTVVWRMALRNALAPSVQVVALTVTYLVGGTVAVETVFSFPGAGSGLVDAVANRDIPVVQAIAMVVATVSLAVYVIADLASTLLIPRERTRL
ncbi:peptide/nickel transport system permease protein [Micromonospora pallida]|uniref:Peptide/nickel transport system permease protein n=1 Tax=Micromonospora pallida TaxID=145854 RepID=A0A1C6RS05_9ACTN|nr:ABC transporter permease [Micromonospora pallida]SCL20000.1 peptide/nickel transport system permease protein [Micromonospora pallida]